MAGAVVVKRVLVLVKRTSYRSYVEEQHDPRVKQLLARGDPTVRRLRRAHDDHVETLREVRSALAELGAQAQVVEGPRSLVEGAFDLVVTVGGDIQIGVYR